MKGTLQSKAANNARGMRSAAEHMHFAELVDHAQGFVLDDATVVEMQACVDSQTASIERNIDLISVPENGYWIEFQDAPRREEGSEALYGAAHPERVGVLVCPDPSEPDKLVMMTAWEFADGSCRHSYAAVALKPSQLRVHALLARKIYGRGWTECLARLTNLATVYFPPQLLDELRAMAELEDASEADIAAAMQTAQRDVVMELPFTLAALLMLTVAEAPAAYDQGGTAGWRARLASLFRGKGFVRSGVERPRLVYRPAGVRRAAPANSSGPAPERYQPSQAAS